MTARLPGSPAIDGRALIFLANVRTASNSTIAAFQESLGPERVFHLRSSGAEGSGSYGDFLRCAAEGTHAVYAGHFVFGAHRHLGRPAEYVTTVREPVERVLSQYAAIRAMTGAAPGLRSWLARYPEANNGMVKRLSGFGLMPGARRVFDGANDRFLDGDVDVGEEHLERALARIDRHFRFVLLFGRQPENLVLLERAYGAGPLFSLHRNFVNAAPKPEPAAHPADVIAEIEDRNRLDARLYALCRARFEALIGGQEPGFADAVATMRLVSVVLGEGGRPATTDERLMGRLYALANLLFERGDGDRAIDVLRGFSAKAVIGERFCRGVLAVIADHGSAAALESEVASFRARFGDAALTKALELRGGQDSGRPRPTSWGR